VVLEELRDAGMPERMRRLAAAIPEWLRQETPQMSSAPASVDLVHKGEAHAIVFGRCAG